MSDQDDTSGELPVPRYDEGSQQGFGVRTQATFGAHLLGTGGLRRGLRGGQAVLLSARGAYLQAEWSGQADRRGAVGLLARRRV